MSIGLKRAENLYQIKKGNNSISKELAELITIKYCNINNSFRTSLACPNQCVRPTIVYGRYLSKSTLVGI